MIGKLGEVILYVNDMAKQAAFYRDILGFRILDPPAEADLSETFWVLFDSGPCQLALHGGGERRFQSSRARVSMAAAALPKTSPRFALARCLRIAVAIAFSRALISAGEGVSTSCGTSATAASRVCSYCRAR